MLAAPRERHARADAGAVAAAYVLGVRATAIMRAFGAISIT